MLLATPLTKVLPTVFVMKPEPLSPEQRDASEDRTSKLLPVISYDRPIQYSHCAGRKWTRVVDSTRHNSVLTDGYVRDWQFDRPEIGVGVCRVERLAHMYQCDIVGKT